MLVAVLAMALRRRSAKPLESRAQGIATPPREVATNL